ncbi:hypothetical protein WS93_24650 [Burkholderia cepacia]|nr:hypothetical protein WS93_24650 [Burkholderia cepacia]
MYVGQMLFSLVSLLDLIDFFERIYKGNLAQNPLALYCADSSGIGWIWCWHLTRCPSWQIRQILLDLRIPLNFIRIHLSLTLINSIVSWNGFARIS